VILITDVCIGTQQFSEAQRKRDYFGQAAVQMWVVSMIEGLPA
jgi:hypothetical protein